MKKITIIKCAVIGLTLYPTISYLGCDLINLEKIFFKNITLTSPLWLLLMKEASEVSKHEIIVYSCSKLSYIKFHISLEARKRHVKPLWYMSWKAGVDETRLYLLFTSNNSCG